MNLSGGIQYQTMQQFENDPKNLGWKSKMLERKRKQSESCHVASSKIINDKPLSLSNNQQIRNSITTTGHGINMVNIDAKKDINLEEIEENGEFEMNSIDNGIKVDEIILRFDNACEAILKQLLLHEFDRFRHTNDYQKYFKYHQKSRKRLGSICKKFQKKTSQILPINHHQSPHLTFMKQLSLHKEHNSPRLTPLTMKKAKSASLTPMRHAAISSNTHLSTTTTNKRHSLEFDSLNMI